MLSQDIIDKVATQLGRAPQGLERIAVWRGENPAVIQVAPMVRRQPFPTLFWLVDPVMSLAIDRIEAAGQISELQVQVDNSVEIRAQMVVDHDRHRRLRDQLLTPEQRAAIVENGFEPVFEQRGVGGIAAQDRIRCLHTWIAAHLVRPNVIGQLSEPLIDPSVFLGLELDSEFLTLGE
jgi:hypothetical protein